ncbi:MAG TPA: hypothetical protein VM143_01235 [Acidimicrobiales bacterium]|nr:hypothetical protein [Acidimicrobiales bacterium]
MPLSDPEAVARLLLPRTVTHVAELGTEWAPVTRVTLDDGRTVVVKERRRGGSGWGYDPGNLCNERAALELLAEVEEASVAPQFVGGDVDAGIVVMTDLAGTTLEALLLEPAAHSDAVTGLVEHGAALGRLHAWTASEAAGSSFVERRARLAPYSSSAERLRFVTFGMPETWAEVGRRAASLGFTPPIGVDDDVADLWGELADPGPFLALTHLDASPQNCVLAPGGRARLVDFEGAGMRHVGLDACFLRFPFPTYGHWAVLPHHVRQPMEDAYRRALCLGVASATDDRAYARMMAVGCGALLAMRIHRLPAIAQDDEQALRRRTQIISAIEVFVEAAEEARSFGALAGWFVGLADEMRGRWAEACQAPRSFPAVPTGAAGP